MWFVPNAHWNCDTYNCMIAWWLPRQSVDNKLMNTILSIATNYVCYNASIPQLQYELKIIAENIQWFRDFAMRRTNVPIPLKHGTCAQLPPLVAGWVRLGRGTNSITCGAGWSYFQLIPEFLLSKGKTCSVTKPLFRSTFIWICCEPAIFGVTCNYHEFDSVDAIWQKRKLVSMLQDVLNFSKTCWWSLAIILCA